MISLDDTEVMAKLGGSQESEAAVDKALAYLVSLQEEDGRWDIAKTGGQASHDVAATAFSLLAFYGRGERHDVVQVEVQLVVHVVDDSVDVTL